MRNIKDRYRFWIFIAVIWLIPFLLLVGMVCAATYYIDPNGSNTSPYDTVAKASTTVKTIVDYIQANYAAANTILISNGTYNSANDYFTFDDANHANTTVIGESTEGIIINPGTANHVVYISSTSASGITIQNVTMIASGAKACIYKNDNVDNLTLTNCIFKSNTDHSGAHLVASLGDTTNISYCKFEHLWTSSSYYPLRFTGDADGTIKYCIFEAAKHAKQAGGISLNGTGTVNFYNNLVMDNYSFGVTVAAGTVTLANNIIFGGIANASGYAIYRSAGTCIANNNFLIGNLKYPTYYISGTVTESNNIKTCANPKFTSFGRKGYIILRLDDTGNWDYMKDVADVFDEYGVTGTAYIYTCLWNANNTDDMRTMVSHGTLEIGCHSYSHPDLTYTHALNITYAGGGNNPVCSYADGNIILTTDGNTDRTVFDITSTSYDTFGELIKTINNWTIAKSTTGGQDADHLSTYTKSSSLKTMTATAVPCDIDYDRTGITSGFFKAEIKDPKDQLITLVDSITDGQIGSIYTCNSWAYPYNVYDADSRAAIIDANYTSSGANSPTTIDGITGGPDIDLFKIYALATTYLTGADEATTRANARAFGLMVAHAGFVVSTYAHNTGEMSLDEWRWCIEEWQSIGSDKLYLGSQQLVAKAIRESGDWANNGDGTWSRTYTTESNHEIKSSSPCIDSGNNTIDVGSTDYAGHHIPRGGGIDIGAYECSPAKLILSK